MKVYLVDGTYELFRHYFAVPSAKDANGAEVGAVRGVLRSVLGMLEGGVTHLGVATDHVIESFRNDLWPDYKTGAGVAPDLLAQFQPLEEALEAMGVVVWPMVEFEADDALAAAAAEASGYAEQVIICTPDKDLSQCVAGDKVVQMDRRTRAIRNEEGVVARFGVSPKSIPDYLALVGDSADGYPGISGWGAKTTATVLAKFERIEDIPEKASQWDLPVRGGVVLAGTLAAELDRALLFKDLATLRTNVPVAATAQRLEWAGPQSAFKEVTRDLGEPGLYEFANRLAGKRRAG